MNRAGVALVALVVMAGAARADASSFDPSFTSHDFEALAQALGDAVTFPNLGTAAPGGVTGFQILGAAGGPRVQTDAHWWQYVSHSNTVGGVLVGQRVVVRKGLPHRLDVGAQVGKVFGDQFWGADLRWGLLEGGTLAPAAALRASYSRLASSTLNRLDVAEAQLVVSKGFLIVSPYAAVGYRRVSARAELGGPTPVGHSTTLDHFTAAVGARLGLLPFLHVIGEVRRATGTSVFLGLGVGL